MQLSILARIVIGGVKKMPGFLVFQLKSFIVRQQGSIQVCGLRVSIG